MDTATRSRARSRQQIRRVLLVITFLLIPVTIFYISPIVVMMGAGEGIVAGGLLLYIALFLVSLVAGRLWCGWLCPMGACQELCQPVMKRTVPDGWRNTIKYGVTVLWLGMLGYSFMKAGGISAVDPFYGTVSGISITSLQILMIVVIIFSSIVIVAFIAGRRGFCHVLCPIAAIMVAGRKIRSLVGWPALELTGEGDRCIDCGKCSKKCPMGLDVQGMVRKDSMEHADCILCAACADTCPRQAITYEMTGR